METIEVGKEAAKHFAFDEGYTNLNHGSYGTFPIEVRQVLREYQERIEARPDAFVRYEYRTKLLNESREAIAGYLKVPVKTCVLTQNTTTAVDAVLRNIFYQPGDVIIGFRTMYDALKNTINHLSITTLVEAHYIEYDLPTSDEALCVKLEGAIHQLREKGKNPKLVLFDTVNALPGVRMPFERLTDICRANNVLSCIDGAHGVGMIPLNLSKLDPDFFASNLHKWLYVPRGCAVLYVPERNQHLMQTTFPTSFGYGTGFVSNFSYVGTLDDSPFLCIPAALQWRQRIVWSPPSPQERRFTYHGEEAVILYLNFLAGTGGGAVAKVLGTEVLRNHAGVLDAYAMTNVRLPLSSTALAGDDKDRIKSIGDWIMKTMILEYHVGLVTFVEDKALWVRLSAQIYLTIDDFDRAGRLLLEVCQRAERGEWITANT